MEGLPSTVLYLLLATCLAATPTIAVSEGGPPGKKVLRATISQDDELRRASQPFLEYARKVLKYAGYQVVRGGDGSCEGTLTIEARGQASFVPVIKHEWRYADQYWAGNNHYTVYKLTPVPTRLCTGARLSGQVVIRTGGKTASVVFGGEIDEDFPGPSSALRAAFNEYFLPALCKLVGGTEGTAVLASVLRDEDKWLRYAAAKALGEIGDPIAVEPLIRALKDRSVYVRRAAAQALRGMKDRRAVEPLIARLGDKDESVRCLAAEALGVLGDPRAAEPLVRKLSDRSARVRRAASQALGKIKDARAVELLIPLLKEKDQSVRQAALIALRTITGQWLLDADPDKWMSWWKRNRNKFEAKESEQTQ